MLSSIGEKGVQLIEERRRTGADGLWASHERDRNHQTERCDRIRVAELSINGHTRSGDSPLPCYVLSYSVTAQLPNFIKVR